MKKEILLISLILMVSVVAFSQDWKVERPNYKKIKKEISKKNSEFYYPKLLKRFAASDTTLTLKEIRHLYYGYTFQDAYSPYGHSGFMDTVNAILNKEELDDIDLDNIIQFSDSVLTENPFNLRAMNSQLFVFEENEDEIGYYHRLNQMSMLYDALISSGDGLEKKTAFYVIFISHEYALLNLLGFEFDGRQSLIEHYDYLEVAENQHKIKGLYFDVSPCLNSISKLLK